MTTRRVPPPVTDFIAGPAERVLARVWQPAVDLLRALQAAIDAELPDYLKPFSQDQGAHVWLAGGAVRASIDGVIPRDLDFCFSTGKAQAIACDFIRSSHDHQVLPVPDRDGKRVVVKLDVLLEPSDRDPFGKVTQLTSVDLVRRFAPSPLDTARQMDFVCCAAALSTKTYARHARFEDDVRERVLRVCAPWAPRASMRRVERFVGRGWSISDDERARLRALAEDPHMPEWDFQGTRPESEGWDYEDR